MLMGFATTPQLSTTLAAAFAALTLGILNSTIITALVTLSIVTTFMAPLAIKILVARMEKEATK